MANTTCKHGMLTLNQPLHMHRTSSKRQYIGIDPRVVLFFPLVVPIRGRAIYSETSNIWFIFYIGFYEQEVKAHKIFFKHKFLAFLYLRLPIIQC